MDPPDLLGPGEVSDGPSNAQHAMEAPRRQPHYGGRVGKQLAAGLVRGRDLVEQFAIASTLVRTPAPL